jgi:hypothetical protein
MKNKAESKRVARLLHAKEKSCYHNAFRAVMELEDYRDAIYVEGIAVTTIGMEIEHAWLMKDGQLVDPNLPDDQVVGFFPGLALAGRIGLAEALALPKPEHSEDLPIFYRFGWGGADSPEFTSARRQASQFVQRARKPSPAKRKKPRGHG